MVGALWIRFVAAKRQQKLDWRVASDRDVTRYPGVVAVEAGWLWWWRLWSCGRRRRLVHQIHRRALVRVAMPPRMIARAERARHALTAR